MENFTENQEKIIIDLVAKNQLNFKEIENDTLNDKLYADKLRDEIYEPAITMLDMYNEFTKNFNRVFKNSSFDNNVFENEIFIKLLKEYIDDNNWCYEDYDLYDRISYFAEDIMDIIEIDDDTYELNKYFTFSEECM